MMKVGNPTQYLPVLGPQFEAAGLELFQHTVDNLDQTLMWVAAVEGTFSTGSFFRENKAVAFATNMTAFRDALVVYFEETGV